MAAYEAEMQDVIILVEEDLTRVTIKMPKEYWRTIHPGNPLMWEGRFYEYVGTQENAPVYRRREC